MYKLSDYISSVVVEMYLIQITSLSCVGLSDVNSTSGLRLRILSRLAVVEITTEKIAVQFFLSLNPKIDNNKIGLYFHDGIFTIKVIISLAPIGKEKEKKIITVAKVRTYKTTTGGPPVYSSLSPSLRPILIFYS